MARYTKKDKDGRYYIESVNGKLESNIFGHTYGEAIDRFAELENADVVPKSEVEKYKLAVKIAEEERNKLLNHYFIDTNIGNGTPLQRAKAEIAREIFEEIEKIACVYKLDGDFYLDNGLYAELKKKYTEE